MFTRENKQSVVIMHLVMKQNITNLVAIHCY